MAIVTGLNIPPDLKDSFLKAIDVKDRRTKISIEKKDIVWRKRNLKNFIADTPLDPVAVLWNNLSDADKAAWDTAASHCGMTGYRLFVQDTTYRIQNNLSGVATPNNNHQYKVMKPSATASTSFYAAQRHGASYKLKQYRSGSKLAYDWVDISEVFAPPLKLEFDYYADLVKVYDWSTWTLRIHFTGTKDGDFAEEYIDIDLLLDTNGWVRFSQELNPDLDEISYYFVRFYGYYVTGTSYFDNFNMEHGGQNWAINPNCDNLDQVYYIRYDRVYYPWEVVLLDERFIADSIYID